MKLETYIKYLEDNAADIKAGKPIKLPVVDRDIFEEKMVKAIVAKSAKELPDGVDLWIKDEKEELAPVPWKIKVIEEIDELFIRPSRGLQIGG